MGGVRGRAPRVRPARSDPASRGVDYNSAVIPATFQTPAAVVLLLGGLLACFAGYRLFRTVLAIYGFILGALVASSLMPAEGTGWMILTWIGGGLAGALVLLVGYFAGVALIGAGIGAFVAHVTAAAFGNEPALWIVILLSVSGALVALVLQRYVIIVATAFGGAQTALVGAAALMGGQTTAEAAARAAYRVYPLDPVPGSYWDVWVWLALGLAGLFVQLGITARRRRR